MKGTTAGEISRHSDLAAVIAAAREHVQTVRTEDGREALVYPSGSRVEWIGPKHEAAPPYIIATRTFHDGDSLAIYVNEFKGAHAQLFADIDSGRITVCLDHDAPDKPSARKHVVSLPIRLSEPFAEWNELVESGWQDQETFCQFLEQNASDCIEPESARLIEICRDFEATTESHFSSAVRLENGDRALAFKSETRPRSEVVIPSKLKFRMPIYFGEEEHDLTALFRYRVVSGKLELRIQWHRLEPVKQAAFRLAATRIAERCGLVPLFGKMV